MLKQLFNIRKIGGLYHWRIGRIGGSVYITRAKAFTVPHIIDLNANEYKWSK